MERGSIGGARAGKASVDGAEAVARLEKLLGCAIAEDDSEILIETEDRMVVGVEGIFQAEGGDLEDADLAVEGEGALEVRDEGLADDVRVLPELTRCVGTLAGEGRRE